jgi:hypothetical protein
VYERRKCKAIPKMLFAGGGYYASACLRSFLNMVHILRTLTLINYDRVGGKVTIKSGKQIGVDPVVRNRS